MGMAAAAAMSSCAAGGTKSSASAPTAGTAAGTPAPEACAAYPSCSEPPISDLGGRTSLFLQRTGPLMSQERQIRYILAGNDGKFLRMGSFRFLGRSVLNLTNLMAIKVGEHMSAITVCVYAGVFGRLTPLVVDLPRNQEPVHIIVLPIGSPGCNFGCYEVATPKCGCT